MSDEVLIRRGKTLVRRLSLAPGEAMPWHRDPFHRVTVIMSGNELAIEDRETGNVERFAIKPGQVDWDEPSDRVHRGVNAGTEPYEEITVFFLDSPKDDPQPTEGRRLGTKLLGPFGVYDGNRRCILPRQLSASFVPLTTR